MRNIIFLVFILLNIASVSAQTVDLYLFNARSRMQNNDFESALYFVNQALEIDEANQSIILLRSEIKTAANDYEGAISDLDLIINTNPEHAAAYFERGMNYEKMGDNFNACLNYKRAFELGIVDAQYIMEKICGDKNISADNLVPDENQNNEINLSDPIQKTKDELKELAVIRNSKQKDIWFMTKEYVPDIPFLQFRADEWFEYTQADKIILKPHKIDNWFK